MLCRGKDIVHLQKPLTRLNDASHPTSKGGRRLTGFISIGPKSLLEHPYRQSHYPAIKQASRLYLAYDASSIIGGHAELSALI